MKSGRRPQSVYRHRKQRETDLQGANATTLEVAAFFQSVSVAAGWFSSAIFLTYTVDSVAFLRIPGLLDKIITGAPAFGNMARILGVNFLRFLSVSFLVLWLSENFVADGDGTKPPFHTVFKGLTPALLAIVAVKYQAISEDPSKRFAVHIWSFLITILIYSLLLSKMKQSRNRSNDYWKIFDRIALAAGVVSCLSLVSMILPHFHGLIALYTSWVLFVVISAFPVLQGIYNGLLTGLTTVLNILVYLARKLFNGSIFIQQPPQEGTKSPV